MKYKSIFLTEEVYNSLKDKASQHGLEVEDYIKYLLAGNFTGKGLELILKPSLKD